jgi:GDP-D-mannose 3', 5'-epimerase
MERVPGGVYPKDDLVVVAGGGGFIGGWMVNHLKQHGCWHVRSVDVKPLDQWCQVHTDADNVVLDLRSQDACRAALADARYVYNFAADMGGMGFIEKHKAECMLSVLINTNLLVSALDVGVDRFFFASSACVYKADAQQQADVIALREADAYPAMPEDGYGWEKLFSERMCRHFREDFGVPTRVARFHNVYGPHGTWDGGREKAPAAICRKVITAKLTGESSIEVWGDGEQTRSFMYIDDCISGVQRLMGSDCAEPTNIGSAELVSVNELVDLVCAIAGVRLRKVHRLDAPKGVRGRNSDNTLIRDVLGWEPSISLAAGMEATYRWIYNQMTARPSPSAAAGKPRQAVS